MNSELSVAFKGIIVMWLPRFDNSHSNLPRLVNSVFVQNAAETLLHGGNERRKDISEEPTKNPWISLVGMWTIENYD